MEEWISSNVCCCFGHILKIVTPSGGMDFAKSSVLVPVLSAINDPKHSLNTQSAYL